MRDVVQTPTWDEPVNQQADQQTHILKGMGHAKHPCGPWMSSHYVSADEMPQVIRAALVDAGLSADALQCAELHGTGTPLGDPIEVGALAAVLTAAGERTAPLLLGAAKAHRGHAEPAAGASAVVRSDARHAGHAHINASPHCLICVPCTCRNQKQL